LVVPDLKVEESDAEERRRRCGVNYLAKEKIEPETSVEDISMTKRESSYR
jgi:hypothetical protein